MPKLIQVFPKPSDSAAEELAQQESLAITAPYQLQPGQAAPAESATTTYSTLASPSSTASSSSSSTSPLTLASTSAASASHSSSLSGGAIGGIVAGSVVGFLLLAILIYLCGRNSVYRQWYKSEKRTQESTESWVSQQPHPHNPATMSQVSSPPLSSSWQSPKPGATVREGYLDPRLSATGLGLSSTTPPVPVSPLPWWVHSPEAGEWAQQSLEPSELHANEKPVELDVRRPTPMPPGGHLGAEEDGAPPAQPAALFATRHDIVKDESKRGGSLS